MNFHYSTTASIALGQTLTSFERYFQSCQSLLKSADVTLSSQLSIVLNSWNPHSYLPLLFLLCLVHIHLCQCLLSTTFKQDNSSAYSSEGLWHAALLTQVINWMIVQWQWHQQCYCHCYQFATTFTFSLSLINSISTTSPVFSLPTFDFFSNNSYFDSSFIHLFYFCRLYIMGQNPGHVTLYMALGTPLWPI